MPMRGMRQAGLLLLLALLFVLSIGRGGMALAAPADSGEERKLAGITARAQQGDSEAQLELGGMYHDGQGVARDYREALRWYRKAAEQSNPYAQYNLGLMYDVGQGVPQDPKEALFWYTKSALQGNSAAQQNLGVLYANGQGVPRNLIFAYAWSALAAEQGQSAATRNRDNAARILSDSQRRTAQELEGKLRDKISEPKGANSPAERVKPSPTAPKGSPLPPLAQGKGSQTKSSGSGFLITDNGYLVTCHHVIAGGRRIVVKVDKNQYPARVVRDDPKNDLALLKIDGAFQPLAFAGQRSASLGQEVFTIGYPDPILQGVSAKFTKGEISSLAGIRDDEKLYQISVPVQPGNSGGALLDLNGNVTGVIVAMLDAKTAFAVSGSLPQNVNYAVKEYLVRALLTGLPAVNDRLPPPSAGLSFEQVVERSSKGAVMVLVQE